MTEFTTSLASEVNRAARKIIFTEDAVRLAHSNLQAADIYQVRMYAIHDINVKFSSSRDIIDASENNAVNAKILTIMASNNLRAAQDLDKSSRKEYDEVIARFVEASGKTNILQDTPLPCKRQRCSIHETPKTPKKRQNYQVYSRNGNNEIFESSVYDFANDESA